VGFLLVTSLFYGQSDDKSDAYTLRQRLDDKAAGSTSERAFGMGYVVGVSDALGLTDKICIPTDRTGNYTVRNGEIEQVVRKYIDDNPTKLHVHAVVATALALQAAYP